LAPVVTLFALALIAVLRRSGGAVGTGETIADGLGAA
jgi:hypothetical protein